MASTIKVTNIDTPDNTGNIIVDRPLSGSGASLTNLPAGGDLRNFIIDGDFTQWPDGTAATTNSSWKSALWFGRPDIGTVEFSRSTDVPTATQSGHRSAYSFKVDCTATGSLASGTKLKLYYWMSGHDYAHLHRQPFVFSFWVKSYQTGTHTCGFQNSAGSRTYIAEYTVTASATWERKTIAVPAESSDSGWLFTEADKGLGVIFGLAVGSAQQTAAGSWTAGNYNGSSNTQNITSSTNNYINIAQLMLTRGTTTPDVFLCESISTVRNQVDYYIEYWSIDANNNAPFIAAEATSSTIVDGIWVFRNAKRRLPSMAVSAANTWLFVPNADKTLGSFGALVTDENACIFRASGVATTTTGYAGHFCSYGATDAWARADARH